MFKIKKILFFVLIITVLVATIYYAYNKGYLNNTPLVNIHKQDVQNFTQDAQEQSQILGSQAQKASLQLQQVLGESIQVDEDNDKPLYAKTIDYGKYLYCKQVVKDYEEKLLQENQ